MSQRGPAKKLVFTDSEAESVGGDDEERLPPGLHNFNLDELPPDEEGDEDMDDEFDLSGGEKGDEDEEMGFGESDDEEVDSAFASSGEEDAEMDENNDPRTAHLRPNPVPADGDDEDGAIMTNLEDDLENEGYTLPAVDRGGEEEEHEHGTSLREVEGRMRWLVGVCCGKEDKASRGVPGKWVKRFDRFRALMCTAGRGPTTCCNCNTT
jgi:ribosomal RNA methyltransferase Nop2